MPKMRMEVKPTHFVALEKLKRLGPLPTTPYGEGDSVHGMTMSAMQERGWVKPVGDLTKLKQFTNRHDGLYEITAAGLLALESPTSVNKKRGRPRKNKS